MHYKDAVVWKKAMTVASEIYRLAPLLPREEVYGIRSQLTRAAVSVPCNIAEGWTRESMREKAHFLAIAHGSLSELETLVTLCEEIGWFPIAQTRDPRAVIDETSRMLTTLRRRQR
ncbi:MAG: four helix bundle protein [Lysobacter sp.]|nr:four helix bundle protein [Lysobacter sp.]